MQVDAAVTAAVAALVRASLLFASSMKLALNLDGLAHVGGDRRVGGVGLPRDVGLGPAVHPQPLVPTAVRSSPSSSRRLESSRSTATTPRRAPG